MSMARALALLTPLVAVAGTAAAQGFVVPQTLWDHPRTGRAVLEEAAIRDAAKAYLAHGGSRLVLHHAPTEEALLRAEELRAWLTALALESPQVTLQNDLTGGDPLRIEVVRP
jgi:hypothetical protein